ncbi:MAG: hypothetical protein IH866_05490, partial [Chloroflexi bacterium]|nr:hypothetical protein [Chloroflexota bacterium]
GISSGAVLRTAQRVAERLDRGNVVLLLADGGWKYLSTELWSKTTTTSRKRSRARSGGSGRWQAAPPSMQK